MSESVTHRKFKDRLYGQFALIGKALASPGRFELLELLAQGPRTVEALANESNLSIANASQHLHVLRQSGLVESEKQGLFVSIASQGGTFLSCVKRCGPLLKPEARNWNVSSAIILATDPNLKQSA